MTWNNQHKTDDTVKELIREMWLAECSSGDIAAAIRSTLGQHATRSSVMGHVRRLGLQGKGGSGQIIKPKVPPPEPRTRPLPPPKPIVHRPLPAPLRPEQFGATVPWTRTTMRHCTALIEFDKWNKPPEEWRVCAIERVEGESWCPHHLQRYKIRDRRGR